MSMLTEDIKKFRSITDGFLTESECCDSKDEPKEMEKDEEVTDEESTKEIEESIKQELSSIMDIDPYDYYGAE